MLVRRGVAHDRRAVLIEHIAHTLFIPDRAYQHHKVKLRVPALELHLDIVGVVFIYVKDHEPAGLERRDLAAELAAYRTAAAGDEHGLAAHLIGHGAVVGAYLRATKQIVNADVLDLLERDLTVCQLAERRQGLERDARDAALFKNFVPDGYRSRGDAEDDLLNAVFLDGVGDHFAPSDDLDAPYARALLAGVVVYKAHCGVARGGIVVKLAYSHGARRACADDEGALLGDRVLMQVPALTHPAVYVARERQQHEEQQRTDKREAARQCLTHYQRGGIVQRGGADGGKAEVEHLALTGIFPAAAV